MRRLPRFLLFLLTILLVVAAAAPTAARDEQEQTDRVSGQTRIDTAVDISQRTFEAADTAVLASSHVWPDALAGAALAGAVGGPILLVHPDEVPAATAQEMDRLGVARTYLLGGEHSMHESVEAELDAQGYDTKRLASTTRHGTAAEIAREAAAVNGGIGQIGGQPTVFVANSLTFPDALAAGPGAYANVSPVLLSHPESLDDRARAAISDLGATQAVLLGGPLALTDHVRQDLEEMDLETIRVGGRDRGDTARKIANFLIARLGFDPEVTLLAASHVFPDALAAAPHGGEARTPLVLATNAQVIGYDTLQWFVNHADEEAGETDIDLVRALGGPNTLSTWALDRAAAVAAPPEAIYTYSVEIRGEGIGADELAYFSEHADWTLVDQRGWSLGNDVRWDRVADPAVADLNLYLATPEEIAAADPDCSPDWSCQPSGTNDVYVNIEEWRNPPAVWDGYSISAYRHYVVLHEFGHAPPMNFGHIRCEEYYADANGDPAPVMEQQSQGDGIGAGQCDLNVWPLRGELDQARDALLAGG